ncbi:molybdopterin-dependent oxidoreductase [Actinomadura sp. LD22]|uniref:Molybdopterin-dependent oxidoreductase n=1 Tax=Actinomadura physcomitrii TaxID=2650748 RepID=A0A6I4MGG4_9ACTN|nr:molybdopterin-dependent oxidoreductase [Actinomadura physcomitrii]MWA04813.1 molybdopterin-dependent oxidoreductase [Actinomadura physcomitrii]
MITDCNDTPWTHSSSRRRAAAVSSHPQEAGTRRTFCRICPMGCPLRVTVEQGRVVAVTGDREDPIYRGFSCVKGRAQPAFLNDPARLRHPLQRLPDGSHRRIGVEDALDEIAAVLARLIDRRGPRSIAGYLGTYVIANALIRPFHRAFMEAIGSPMDFGAATIDKPGKPMARALLGSWGAPAQEFDRPDAILLVGVNPLVSYQGLPLGRPGEWLAERLAAGTELIVVDPRRSETARRATLHLQPEPGHDIGILAAILRTVLRERRHDEDFVSRHASGSAELTRALEPFDPTLVAARCGVDPEEIVEAARRFAGPPGEKRRGYAMAGTGPNMTGSGTLVEYLVQALDLVCGHVLREGEEIANAGVLLPPPVARAEVTVAPRPAAGFGEPLRVRGLTATAAGMPTAALADEMLLEGPGQVRALLSICGNPAAAFPDQRRTVRALSGLELLVQVDPWMSATAELADYVLPPLMPFEQPSATFLQDTQVLHAVGYGTPTPHGQYTPAVADPPEDSDLLSEWQFYRGLAARLDLPLTLRSLFPDATWTHEIGPADSPSTEELLAVLATGSRVPWEIVRGTDGPVGPSVIPPPPVVGPPTSLGLRFDLANAEMLAQLAGHSGDVVVADPALPFRLVCRRVVHAFNSSCRHPATQRGGPGNPAYLHPSDLADLGLAEGAAVVVRSRQAEVRTIVAADPHLRRGVVSMAHGYGDLPGLDRPDRGANTSRLLGFADDFDPLSGQPRMTAVPVAVEAAPPTQTSC